jgi:hypothetical protein
MGRKRDLEKEGNESENGARHQVLAITRGRNQGVGIFLGVSLTPWTCTRPIGTVG